MKKLPFSLLPIFLFTVIFLTCATCSIVPGHISESVSKTDNTKEIYMNPASLYESHIKLGLFKNSKMPENIVILIAEVSGNRDFAKGDSLHFLIDGDLVSFASIEESTHYYTMPGLHGFGIYRPRSYWSWKRYVITKDFIQRIINAKKVFVKVELEKTYVEGEFSYDAYPLARPAFREFYKKIEQW